MVWMNGRMVAALLTAGLLIGIASRAQAAPAYVVNEIEVTDQAGFKTYADQQGALIQSFGGHFLARGGATETLEGAKAGSHVTIYVFENMDRLKSWRSAPEQQELTALRDRSSHFRAFAVEGLSN